MQQLFLGIPPENLSKPPFAPAVTRGQVEKVGSRIPIIKEADMLIVPNIAGFVGADTISCILASGMEKTRETTLPVDIGTNGEMALGNRERRIWNWQRIPDFPEALPKICVSSQNKTICLR